MRVKILNYRVYIHIVTDKDYKFYIKIFEHIFIIEVQEYFSPNIHFGK